MVFYVCSIVAFALITTIYRCEMIENAIGFQKINSVGDCDNLITVNCFNQCDEIYGDKISDEHLYLQPRANIYGTHQGKFMVSSKRSLRSRLNKSW